MDIHNHFYIQNEAAIPEICISQNKEEFLIINISIEKQKTNKLLSKWYDKLKKFAVEEQSNYFYR